MGNKIRCVTHVRQKSIASHMCCDELPNAYAKIREGKDLSSEIVLVDCFERVMSIKTELKLKL